MGLDIAFAASVRDWPDRVHRHLLDHGGARVSGRLMGAVQCVDAEFDVIFIDDVCSFLSSHLVAVLRERGRVVIGVYDTRDSPDAKRRLLECGISDVIESDATTDEFVARAAAAMSESMVVVDRSRPRPRRGRAVGVIGITGGVGVTEISVALAHRLSERLSTVLVDLDPMWPSIAQRLDLPPHPNLRALVDVVLHEGEIESALTASEGLRVVAGSPWGRTSNPLPLEEIALSLQALSERFEVLVADLGSEEAQSDLLHGFDTVIVVASGDPIGVARLIGARDRLERLMDQVSVLVVINKTHGGGFHRGEIRAELSPALGGVPFVTALQDERVAAAAWEGRPTGRGRFNREVGRIADLVAGMVPR